MIMSDKADLRFRGTHCSLAGCRRVDFAPFHCSDCRRVFCPDHYAPGSHGCSHFSSADAAVPVCPICNQIIKKSEDEDINAQVEKHILSGCKSLVVGNPEPSNWCYHNTCHHHGHRSCHH